MSLYSRRAILCLPLALSACGFQPVYGTGGTGNALQNNVEVVELDTVEGYLLTRRLEERLGRASVSKYRLETSVDVTREKLDVNTESNINRFNFIGVAKYTLVEQSTGRTVVSGKVDNFAGASQSGTTVASLAAERDARQRLMVLLADQITVRLLSANLT